MERQTQVEDYVQDTIRAKADFIQLTRDAFPELARLTKTMKEKGIGINCFYAKSKEEVKMYIFTRLQEYYQMTGKEKIESAFDIKILRYGTI